jgi:hypothetical protein
MKQLITTSAMEGKTIKRVAFTSSCSGKPVIVFTDDTYAVFEINFGYDPGDGDIELLVDKLENDEQRDVEFITPEEYEAIQKKESQRYKRQDEARERKQLEHLKQKYGG